MHFQHELVDRARLRGKLAAVPHGHRARDIGGVAVPFAPGVDEKDLRVEDLGAVVGEVVLVVMIVGFDGAPRELAIVAAIMQG